MHRQICIIGLVAAIRFLHHHNITIRYLHPDLIILDEKYYPKIFNIFVDYKQLDTQQLIPYLAPELFDYPYESDNPKSLDIYSLGRIIYLLLIGVEPFKHKNDICRKYTTFSLMNKIFHNECFPYFPDEIPMPFQELLQRCWSFNPIERPTIDQIYDLIVNEFPHNEYFFIDHFQMREIHEISDYINKLKNFEQQKDELSIFETSSIDIEMKDQSTQKMITSLNAFIDRNSVEGNESEFFTLIKEFSKTDDFYELGYFITLICEGINASFILNIAKWRTSNLLTLSLLLPRRN